MLIDLVTTPERKITFAAVSDVAAISVLCPVGTAKRNFLTVNRVLSSTRCRLTPNRVNECSNVLYVLILMS